MAVRCANGVAAFELCRLSSHVILATCLTGQISGLLGERRRGRRLWRPPRGRLARASSSSSRRTSVPVSGERRGPEVAPGERKGCPKAVAVILILHFGPLRARSGNCISEASFCWLLSRRESIRWVSKEEKEGRTQRAHLFSRCLLQTSEEPLGFKASLFSLVRSSKTVRSKTLRLRNFPLKISCEQQH